MNEIYPSSICYVQLSSYNKYLLDEHSNRMKHLVKLISSHIFVCEMGLPKLKKKYVVLRSVHKHKKSWDQFEIRTYCKILKLNFTDNKSEAYFFHFLENTFFSGLSVKISKYQYLDLSRVLL
jgi:ribosomal protein S10